MYINLTIWKIQNLNFTTKIIKSITTPNRNRWHRGRFFFCRFFWKWLTSKFIESMFSFHKWCLLYYSYLHFHFRNDTVYASLPQSSRHAINRRELNLFSRFLVSILVVSSWHFVFASSSFGFCPESLDSESVVDSFPATRFCNRSSTVMALLTKYFSSFSKKKAVKCLGMSPKNGLSIFFG